jgi:hypothetical protein
MVASPLAGRFSHSLSQYTFAVSRVPQAWVVWGYIH